MDSYKTLRELPLKGVLDFLGIQQEWKSRKGGTEWVGACPLHQPKNNRSSFSFTSEIYHCFSCGAKGKGAIDLTMAIRGIGFQEAVELLKGADISPETSQTLSEPSEPITENEARTFTYEKYYVPSIWLTARGFTTDTLKLYGVGEYNNPNRTSNYKGKILIRIQRFDGLTVGYLVRTPNPKEGEPKYLFPKGIHKDLEVFGAWQLKNDIKVVGGQAPFHRVVYLVESPFSVLKFHQPGLYAVSCFGAYVSEAQVTILKQLAKGFVYLPDRDKYGQIGDSIQRLSNVCWVKCPELPQGCNDPEHLTAEQISALT